MKSIAIASLILGGIMTSPAQTNSPPLFHTPSPTPPASVKAATSTSVAVTTPTAVANTASTTKPIPVLTPKESDLSRSRNGLEYRGLVVGLPRPAGQKFNPFQLINPFAPASYGGTGGGAQAPLPRSFRDERTHEPEGITLISVSK